MLAMTGVVLLPVVAFVSLRIKHVIANEEKQSICQESKSRVT